MNIDIKDLQEYKIAESDAFNVTDQKHIENYKQLIKFFENAVQNSLDGGKTNYPALHGSCLQCIRFLDDLIHSYNTSLQNVRFLNSNIDGIINSKTSLENIGAELGNEKS